MDGMTINHIVSIDHGSYHIYIYIYNMVIWLFKILLASKIWDDMISLVV